MGGAFVAVADDSSATWWNPAGLAAGPFLDLALGRAVTDAAEGIPARRDGVGWFALATPPVGVAYYRLRLIDIQPFDPTTGNGDVSREDRRAGVPVRALSASQLGVTLVHSIFSGFHAGTTVKYVRGTLRGGREDGLARPSDLLDLGEEFEGGDAQSRLDLDVGLLGVAGPFRVGGVVRNLLQPEFDGEAFGGSPGPTLRLPRQVRIGAAFDPEDVTGVPLTLALDADVRAYPTGSGDRRVVAIGGEQWLASRRVGVRAGARFNTTGARDRSATAGVSVSPRAGMYLDGHVVRGGSVDDRGWGVVARISF